MEQTGKSIDIYPAAYWAATMPADKQKTYLDDEPKIRAKWDAQFSDRRNQVVFIGIHLEKVAIEMQLDAYLLTDEEMRTDWTTFLDPFTWDMAEWEAKA